MAAVLALIDCNNFYAACEQAFDPALIGRPLVVLSNNDGCIVARSREARQLGIAMGTPYFQVADRLRDQQVVVRSSNYALYGDMSQRVMALLKQRCRSWRCIPSMSLARLPSCPPMSSVAGLQSCGWWCVSSWACPLPLAWPLEGAGQVGQSLGQAGSRPHGRLQSAAGAPAAGSLGGGGR